MSVYQQSSKSWSYKFMSRGKYYTGVCHGCKTKKQALEFEKEIKGKASDLSKMKTVLALTENYRKELAGGTSISLSDAFVLAQKKPRTRPVGEKFKEQKHRYWLDFVSFIKSYDENIVSIDQVERKHAEAYMHSLATVGRHCKTVSYQIGKQKRKYENKTIPSSRTQIMTHRTLKEVFTLLAKDAGLIENPFDFKPPKIQSESREAFSEDELQRIIDVADDFVRPLVVTGISTAMRLGDCCTLLWEEIDLQRSVIRRKQRKTGGVIEIPLFPKMAEGVEIQKEKRNQNIEGWGKYLFPEQAKMYSENPDGIHWRISKVFEAAGIETTKEVPGRTRKVTARGFHSLRHTFAYLAGKHGIPLPVVQSICGHMSPEMTKHYMSHATLADKRAVAAVMPNLLGADEACETEEPDRQRLKSLAGTLPIETVRQILAAYEKLSSGSK